MAIVNCITENDRSFYYHPNDKQRNLLQSMNASTIFQHPSKLKLKKRKIVVNHQKFERNCNFHLSYLSVTLFFWRVQLRPRFMIEEKQFILQWCHNSWHQEKFKIFQIIKRDTTRVLSLNYSRKWRSRRPRSLLNHNPHHHHLHQAPLQQHQILQGGRGKLKLQLAEWPENI